MSRAENITIRLNGIEPFVTAEERESFVHRALCAFDTLTGKEGRGNDFLGWIDLPVNKEVTDIERVVEIAERWRENTDVVVVVGIGGSYLGAKAAIEALVNPFSLFSEVKTSPSIVFAGHNLSEEYMGELLEMLEMKRVAIVVISKSGTTTEPAVAFRILKGFMERKYGKEGAGERIVSVTDASKGALKRVSLKEGYHTFTIPDDVGGRYSVLTPVGLLPMALAGIDVRSILEGAMDMRSLLLRKERENPAVMYAAARNLLYSKGKKTEILVNYNPKFQYLSEWWKQLFGESEGKEGKGIYPASVNFTTDLHSMGQYIQEGERTIFETSLIVENSLKSVTITKDEDDLDGLGFLSGRHIEECNKMAAAGTMLAHIDGGVPNITINIPQIDAYTVGALFYFFEFSCGVSAYMLEINPFDQPGVEAYKTNMFALLGKPGYEDLASKLRERMR